MSILLLSAVAQGHHILGVPHYAYDEQYPQAPVLTYLVDAGAHEVRMTGYPGKPDPGDRCALNVYIKRRDDGRLFDGKVTLVTMRNRILGEDPVVYGPVEASLEEAVYKFYPRFAEEADYTVRIAFEANGEPWKIDLPMVAGEPGSPWAVLGSAIGGMVLLVVVVRAIRIKRRRQAVAPEALEGAAP